MPRRVDDSYQPKIALTASDLGEEAYRANLKDKPGRDNTHRGDQAGTVPIWQSPEARNAPPGQHRKDAQEVKMGRDPKPHHGTQDHTPGGPD
ncbi:MAG: hypothetical protein ACOY94_17030 [Bacillota bacterium]